MFDWTCGVELEYGNVSLDCKLPGGATWNDKDNTVVSSTGIANDPKGVLYRFGGEINTSPCANIDEQVQHIDDIIACLDPAPIINYRSNLHIHVRVPGLKDDLDGLKKLLEYVTNYQQEAFACVEHIPVPNINDCKSREEFDWAMKRYKRRLRSHQYKLPEARVEAMMKATTPQEWYEEHVHLDSKGNRDWFHSVRAGINMRQMFEETETIEFRHFPGTLSNREMKDSIRWCYDFLDSALNTGLTPRQLIVKGNYKFPEFQPYEFETEQVYQWTNHDKNKKSVIKERLENLRKVIDIDDMETPSTAVYEHIKPKEETTGGLEAFF